MNIISTKVAVVAAALLAAACVTSAGENLVPLTTPLPKPQYSGTPKPLKLPNLDPQSGPDKHRGVFLVPAGSINLAAKKKVTSSDPAPVIGDLMMITDGDKEATEGSYVELGRGKQWVQIDLGQESTVTAILVWFFHGEACAFHDVVVQVSDDKDFKSGVKVLYNNDYDNSSGFGVGKDYAWIETNEGRLIDAKGVSARYVRINTNGNTSTEMNRYIEVEVWGKAAK